MSASINWPTAVLFSVLIVVTGFVLCYSLKYSLEKKRAEHVVEEKRAERERIKEATQKDPRNLQVATDLELERGKLVLERGRTTLLADENKALQKRIEDLKSDMATMREERKSRLITSPKVASSQQSTNLGLAGSEPLGTVPEEPTTRHPPA